MFRLIIPITKKVKTANGKVLVSGVASDPSIDRDSERFSSEAVSKMVERVNNAAIPIRLEHEDKVYTDIGVWKSASLGDDMKMYVEGELDTELSLGRDIAVLLDRGVPMALSVGGNVLKAGYEYAAELGKNVKVYLDVILEEISITKNPSNYNASLSLAKSVNWEKVDPSGLTETTVDGEKVQKHFKTMQPLSTGEFEEALKKSFKEKMESGTVQKFWSDVFDNGLAPIIERNKVQKSSVEKDCCDSICEPSVYQPAGLTPTDLQTIIMLTRFLTQVEIPVDAEMPSEFMDYMFMSSLPEECFVILENRSTVLPHHNPNDLSVNKAFLAWCLKSLFDKYSYWTSKEYAIILPHLYRHVVDLANSENVPVSKEDSEPSSKEDAVSKASLFDASQLDLLKSVYEHSIKEPSAPFIYDGKEIPLSDVTKMVSAYQLVLKANSQPMEPEVKKEDEVTTPVAPVEPAAPAESEAEVEKKKKAGLPVCKECTDGTCKSCKAGETKPMEETEKAKQPEMMTEDQWKEKNKDKLMTADEWEKAKSKGKTKKSEGEGEPAEVVGAEAAVVAPVETPVEPVVEAAATEEVAKSFSGFEKKVSDKLENFAKNLEDVATVAKSLTEKVAQMDEFSKSLATMSSIVEKLAEGFATRKSVAVGSVFNTVEKSVSAEPKIETTDPGVLAAQYMDADKSLSAQDAYKKARVALSQNAQ